MWPGSKESPEFFLFENIHNLAQLLLIPELSSFIFDPSGVHLGIIRGKRRHPSRGERDIPHCFLKGKRDITHHFGKSFIKLL
jgi:hypothetical protein